MWGMVVSFGKHCRCTSGRYRPQRVPGGPRPAGRGWHEGGEDSADDLR